MDNITQLRVVRQEKDLVELCILEKVWRTGTVSASLEEAAPPFSGKSIPVICIAPLSYNDSLYEILVGMYSLTKKQG